MASLQNHQQRFLKSSDYTWGDGKARAEAEVSATKAEVGGGMGSVQSQVTPGVNAAETRTENIGPGDFRDHPADRHKPLQPSRVEGQETLDQAEEMRDKNEQDKASVSRPFDTVLFDRNKAVKAVNDAASPLEGDVFINP
jgi:hypothetical protein